MDTTQAITYRSADLNDVVVTADVPRGNQVNRLNISPLRAAGYTEKRAQGDGKDASDVYLESRDITVAGQTYGTSRADMFDRLWVLLAAFSPTLGYQEDPANKGYEPLFFRVPTLDTDFTADGDGNRWIDLFIRCRPRAGAGFVIDRDRIGGPDTGSTIPWEASLEAVDPRIYIATAQEVAFGPSSSLVTSGMGTFTHRGQYVSGLDVELVVPAESGAMVFDLTVAGSHTTVDISDAAVEQTIRWSSRDNVLTLEQASVETLRMDLVGLLNDVQHPIVRPGGSAYEWSLSGSGVPGNTSFFRYHEAYA